MTQHPASEEAILHLSESLRRLALELVHDPATAEDLVQETWVAALQAPRDKILDLGAWMRRVLRRGASRRARDARQRLERERRAARPDVQRDRDLAEWRSSAHRLIEAVAQLEHPYASVLRSRFFEERSVEEVARLLDVPTGTVKTWTRRGIGQLRARLEREDGAEPEGWALALLPLIRSGPSSPPPPRAMRAPWVAGIAATSALVALLVVMRVSAQPERDVVLTPAAPSVAIVADAPAPALAEGRRPALETTPLDEIPGTTADAQRHLRVLVRDEADRPLVGATVVLVEDETTELARATTDAEGAAAFAIDPATLDIQPSIQSPHPLVRLHAFAPGLAASDAYVVPLPPGPAAELELRLSTPARACEGWLVDEYGDPVEGAFLRALRTPSDQRSAREDVVVALHRETTFSDEDGRFSFEHLRPGTTILQVLRADFLPLQIRLPEDPLELPMETTHRLEHGAAIYGALRNPDGSPAVGAMVKLVLLPTRRQLSTHTTTDATGGYALRGVPSELCLVFASSGDDPSVGARTRIHGGRTPETEWNATLAPLEGVAVRCVDAEDRPLVGRVLLLGVMLESGAWTQLAQTDAEGRARFRTVPDSTFQLRVHADGFPRTQAVDALVSDLRPTAQEQLIRVETPELEPPASFELRALLPDAAPAAGARLLLFNHSSTAEQRAELDPRTGRLTHGPLEPGRYTARVLFPDLGLVELGSFELEPGQTLDHGLVELPEPVPLELPPGPRAQLELSGLYTLDGHLHRHRVRVVDREHGARLMLLPGEYGLRAFAKPGAPELRFSLRAGEPLQVDPEHGPDR